MCLLRLGLSANAGRPRQRFPQYLAGARRVARRDEYSRGPRRRKLVRAVLQWAVLGVVASLSCGLVRAPHWTPPTAAIYRAATGRNNCPASPFNEAALIVGRRGGKSRALATIAVFLATFRDYAQFLAPGEVATVAVLAANRAQARTIFRYIIGLLRGIPLLSSMVVGETGEAIELSNRVFIEIGTASFRTIRGYSFAAVLCDEIAFWRSDETSANPDTEILRALRPGMANIPGSILLMASSPYAKRGELYSAYRRHFGKDDARVLVWKADTATINPGIDPAIISGAYKFGP